MCPPTPIRMGTFFHLPMARAGLFCLGWRGNVHARLKPPTTI